MSISVRRITITKLNTILNALLLIIWEPIPALGFYNVPGYQPVIDNSVRFELRQRSGNFILLVGTEKGQKENVMPRAWFIPREDEEQNYVSSFNYDTIVTSFTIGDGRLGLHLSSYEIQKEGSAQAAAGRDVFIVYDPIKHTLHPGITALGITKERVRSMGFSARNSRFLLGDINRDGLKDIGIIKEEFQCEQFNDGRSRIEKPLYRIDPVQWYVFNREQWVYDQSVDEKFPVGDYGELPLIGIVKSPVDFVKEVCLRKQIHIFDYSDFGVQAMAYELLGYQWYQWNSHGAPDQKAKYSIKVVVYNHIRLEEVRRLYPVLKVMKQDYRYVAYDTALTYLNSNIKEIEQMHFEDRDKNNQDLFNDLLYTLEGTKRDILNKLGE